LKNTRKGQVYVYGILAGVILLVLIAVLLSAPIMSSQKITFSVENDQIENPTFVKERDSLLSGFLSNLESQPNSNTKVELLAYNQSDSECLDQFGYNQDCEPVRNETIWTTPEQM
jgi:hypothetical protein